MEKNVYVFICEDETLAKELVHSYLEKGKITYANMMPSEKREEVTAALDAIV